MTYYVVDDVTTGETKKVCIFVLNYYWKLIQETEDSLQFILNKLKLHAINNKEKSSKKAVATHTFLKKSFSILDPLRIFMAWMTKKRMFYLFLLIAIIYSFSNLFLTGRLFLLQHSANISPHTRAGMDWGGSLSNPPNGVSGGCRNTIQGSYWIADHRGMLIVFFCEWFFSGFVCDRRELDLKKPGCCHIEDASEKLTLLRNNNHSSLVTPQFSCNYCNTTSQCCAVYEYCVSCCMAPLHVNCKWKKKNFRYSFDRFHNYNLKSKNIWAECHLTIFLLGWIWDLVQWMTRLRIRLILAAHCVEFPQNLFIEIMTSKIPSINIVISWMLTYDESSRTQHAQHFNFCIEESQ